MNRKQTLIFLHIPKTAGSTFSSILAHLYPERIYSSYDFAKATQFQSIPESQRTEIALLQGHFAYGIHNYIPHSSQYITFLRNPVERIVSFYYYILRQTDIYLYDIVVNGKMPLAEFVNSSISPEISNLQVKMIAGHSQEDGNLPEKVNSASLEVAKKRLAKDFAAFGLTERFDESLLLFSHKLHWPAGSQNLAYSTLNRDPTRESRTEVTPQVVDDIRRNNVLDMQLYEYAAKLFEKRLGNPKYVGTKLAVVRLLESIKKHLVARKIR